MAAVLNVEFFFLCVWMRACMRACECVCCQSFINMFFFFSFLLKENRPFFNVTPPLLDICPSPHQKQQQKKNRFLFTGYFPYILWFFSPTFNFYKNKIKKKKKTGVDLGVVSWCCMDTERGHAVLLLGMLNQWTPERHENTVCFQGSLIFSVHAHP